MPQEHNLKSAKPMTAQGIVDKKDPKLTYFDKRKPENKMRWRNHFKFVGILPDFRGFEGVNFKPVIPAKSFREKRTFINIFEWLKPDEFLLTAAKACKKFHILSWN